MLLSLPHMLRSTDWPRSLTDQGKMMQSMTPLFAAMTQGIRKLEEQAQQAEQLADRDPAEEPARQTTKNTRRYAKAGAAEKHSLGLHGEQMLLAVVRGNRRFRAHKRRLDLHAL